MPLFTNKFSQRKTAPRKSPSLSNLHRDTGSQNNPAEFGIDYGPVSLKLGNVQSTFQEGKWFTDVQNAGPYSKEVAKLKRQNQELKEENNLLKLKVEILLDMLAETTAETHLQTKEIEQLRALRSKKVTTLQKKR